jgi:hypothetical protein
MRASLGIALLLTLFVQVRVPIPLPKAGDFPKFVEIADKTGLRLMNLSRSQANYILEVNGNGAGFFDYDDDGDMDVLIANSSTLNQYKEGGDPVVALYKNEMGRFIDVTGPAGLGKRGWGMGVCVADYDNDGDQDFYVTAYGSNVMYRNNNDGTFSDVTSYTGTGDSHWSTNCAFGDYDRDGNVDLYVANYLTFQTGVVPKKGESRNCRYMGADVFCGPLGLLGEPDTLYRNNGDGTFADVTSKAGIVDPGSYGFGVMFSDLDNDGWLDIYVANDSVPNFLFRNNRDGTFFEAGLASGASLSAQGLSQASMGLTIGDYDGNGHLDIFVTNFVRETNTLYRNMGGLIFHDASYAAGLGSTSLSRMGWGTGFADLDNDGWQDLFVANGHVLPEIDRLKVGQHYLQRKEVYRNQGNGRFREIAAVGDALLAPKSTRGLAFGDYDDDGDIDVLAINMNDRPSLYRNEGGSRNQWIGFRLEGTRSNRDAIGARIEIESGGRRQVQEVYSGASYLSHNDMRVHFGLGKERRVEKVRIRWPNGDTEELGGVSAGRMISVREGEGIIDGGRSL